MVGRGLRRRVRLLMSALHRAFQRPAGFTKAPSGDLEQGAAPEDPLKELQNVPFLTSVRDLARLFFFDRRTRRKAGLLSLGVLAALGVESLMLLTYSNIQKAYMTALEQKDAEQFYAGLRKVAWLICAILPVIGSHTYLHWSLSIEWRAAITRNLVHGYLAASGQTSPGAFYRLTLGGSLDNPDQRICQDVMDFVTDGLSLVVDVLGSVMRVVGFVGVLYKISPGTCFGILAYSGLSTFGAIYLFGRRIFRSQQLLTKQEATLRYCLIRVRENAESIAFFKGGLSENSRFGELYDRLIHEVYILAASISGFTTYNSAVRFCTFAVPALLVGPMYMRGEVEFGAIAQTQFAFSMVMDGVMLILSRMSSISGLGVKVARLHSLQQVLDREASLASSREMGSLGVPGHVSLQEHDEDHRPVLELSNFTLRTPPRAGCMQETLVDGLNLCVMSGQSLLIVGESGIGKSSLLRGIAGLWSDGLGAVRRRGGNAAFFMPQRPYMCLGTLREQLLYPRIGRSVTEDSLCSALRDVRLGYLLERHGLDTVKEWSSLLSLGEQQRLNFARVLLLPQVQLVLLDEGTSACDSANEAHLYELLQRRLRSYISVGHRPALRRFHSHALWLQRPEGSPASSSFASVRDGRVCPDTGHHEAATATCMPMADFERLGITF